MTTFTTTSAMANGGSITVTWVSGPGTPPPEDPPAGVPARTGPRPGTPPVLAAACASPENTEARR
jgi:hypothetical protein